MLKKKKIDPCQSTWTAQADRGRNFSLSLNFIHLEGLFYLINKSNGIYRIFHELTAQPHSSVGRVADLRTGGRWFDPRLGRYSSRRLMIVIVTEFIPLSPLSVVSTMVTWESSQWLGKNVEHSTG